MKKKGRISKYAGKVFSGAGVLAACSIVAKFLGALFRVPLTNIIGAEGMGLYQMVFPLYTVLLTLTSGGLSSAISKLVAVRAAKDDKKGLKKILSVSLLSVLCISGAAAAMLILFRGTIASMQGNAKASFAYAAIAPAIVLVSLISCLKGYFQGLNNMLHSGISQLIEQFVKLVLGLFLASLLLPYGIEYAVFGALAGVTASEAATFIYLIANYTFTRLKSRRKSVLSARRLNRLLNTEAALEVGTEYFYAPDMGYSRSGEVIRDLYKIALPITLGSLIMPLTQVIDSVMVINLLALQGTARADATALFGLVSGPISSLINMPLVITLAFSVALLPKIAVKTQDKSDSKAMVGSLIQSGLRYVLIFSLPCAAVFMFFSKEVLQALYAGGLSQDQLTLCARLLKIESLSIIFVGLIQISTSVLQGANMAARPALNLLFGAVIKVLLTLLLLPLLGITGAAIASSCCYAVTAFLDLFCLKKLGKLKFTLTPLIGSVAMIVISRLIFMLLSSFINQLYALIISLLIGGMVYLALLLVTKTLKVKELLG